MASTLCTVSLSLCAEVIYNKSMSYKGVYIMAELRLEHIYKIYDKNIQAVTDFNLHIHNKEFIVFVGPSGCGKTTTLRMIAGLEDISKGELYIDGVLMNDVASKDRSIAMVFQSYALYPHMTVYDNMAFSLKLRKVDKKEIDHRVKEAAKILGLEDYLKRKPKALSGGQRQRVALGRAIVRDAKVFLMDEPLSNLDAKLRVQMRAEIQKLHQRIQTTTIYVTHDQTEAMTMATRLVVMKDGLIQQIGTPKEVYNTPHNMFVAGFIGSPSMNLFHCHLTETEILLGEQSFPIPSMYVPLLKEKNYLGKEIVMGIRPEDLQITDAVSPFAFKATIDVTELLGAETYLYCSLNNQNFIARVQADNNLHPSDRVSFVMREEKIHFFDPETEERL